MHIFETPPLACKMNMDHFQAVCYHSLLDVRAPPQVHSSSMWALGSALGQNQPTLLKSATKAFWAKLADFAWEYILFFQLGCKEGTSSHGKCFIAGVIIFFQLQKNLKEDFWHQPKQQLFPQSPQKTGYLLLAHLGEDWLCGGHEIQQVCASPLLK